MPETTQINLIHVKQPTPWGGECETIATTSPCGRYGITINRFNDEPQGLHIGIGPAGGSPEQVSTCNLAPEQVMEVLKFLNAWAMEGAPDASLKH